MVHLILEKKTGGEWWLYLTGPQIQQLRQAKSVESVAAQADWNVMTTGGDVPDDLHAIYRSGNAIDHFGVPPALGRGLTSPDAQGSLEVWLRLEATNTIEIWVLGPGAHRPN